MALTQCPECKGTISTTVDQCIHCGCKLAHCPECGMTVTSSTANCPECGTEIKASANDAWAVNPTAQVSNKNITAAYQEWKASSPILANSEIITIVAYLIALASALLSTAFFNNLSDNMFLFSVVMLFAFSVLIIGDIADNIFPIMRAKSFWNWSIRHKYSLPECTDKALQADFKNMDSQTKRAYKKSIEASINAHYYTTDSNAASSYILLGLGKTVTNSLGMSSLILFVVLNMKNIFSAHFSLTNLDYKWMAIAGIVLLAIQFLILARVSFKQDENRTAWIRNEYKDNFQNYNANVGNEI